MFSLKVYCYQQNKLDFTFIVDDQHYSPMKDTIKHRVLMTLSPGNCEKLQEFVRVFNFDVCFSFLLVSYPHLKKAKNTDVPILINNKLLSKS